MYFDAFIYTRELPLTQEVVGQLTCGWSDVEALSDISSGLTYPALTGARKQSVVDAERLFSPDLVAFMHKKGYLYEAKYIETV